MHGLVSIVQRFVAEESLAATKTSTAGAQSGGAPLTVDTPAVLTLDEILNEAEAAASELLKYSTGTGTIKRFSKARELLSVAIRKADLGELIQIGSSQGFELMSLGTNKDLPCKLALDDEAVESEFDGLLCFKWLLRNMLYRQPYAVSKDLLLDARLQSELLMVPELFKAYIRFVFGSLYNYVYAGESSAHAQFYREAVESMLALVNNCDANGLEVFSQCFTQSYPGYWPVCSNESLKELAIAFRRLTTVILPEHSGNVEPQPLVVKSETNKKIKVGLLRYSFDTTIHALLGPISRLDRSKFDIIVFAFDSRGLDECKKWYANLEYRKLDAQDVIFSFNKMRDAELDVLINGYPLHFWSFEPSARALLKRVAKIQCLWSADIVTSGMETVDYLLVGDQYKQLRFEDQFIEKPVFIPGTGQFIPSAIWEQRPMTKARKELRLKESEIVYLSTANILKLNPEVLSVWLRIVGAVDSSRLVLAPFSYPELMDKYRRRLWRAIDQQCQETGVPRSKITIYDLQGPGSVQNLIDACDVFLDCFPLSGKITSTEALLGGKPVVALDGALLRSNFSAGILRAMGLNDLVAKNLDEYIEKAVRLGQDTEYRSEIATKILVTTNDSGHIDPTQLAQGLENALLDIVANHQSANA
jgi:predicted O-linked N-acetylglucosamine transferase (SPINDLY family)